MRTKNSEYRIGGVSCEALAEKMGTPLQIFDQEKIENRLQEYQTYFKSHRFETGVIYASKAFLCKAMLELLEEQNFCLDVVSGGELHCAKTSNFTMSRIFFHGNNKSQAELEQALEYGVGTVVLDNPEETELLISLAEEKRKRIDVLIRINPGIEAHTHKYIMTAHLDSKFGISIRKKEEIVNMIRSIEKSAFVNFEGIHAHIGSQIFDVQAFREEVRILAKFAEVLEKEDGIPVHTFDLGGGFAATYTAEDSPIPIQEACRAVLKACEEEADKRDLTLRRVFIEPGRSLIAEAGSTLYRIGFQKDTESKHYIFIDGGMADNIRPTLYQAKYNCDNISRLNEAKTVWTTVAGKCCESGDILIEDILLPPCENGNLLLVYTTGAYGYSMASNYNRLPRPAAVFVKNGNARCVLRRETFQDLEALECSDPVEI